MWVPSTDVESRRLMKLTGRKGSPLFVGTTLFVHVDRDACDNIDEYAVTEEVDILVRATFILSPAKMLGPSEINFRALSVDQQGYSSVQGYSLLW